jgi:hypothetical protein
MSALAGVLFGLSTVLPWWTISGNFGYGTVPPYNTIMFLPGELLKGMDVRGLSSSETYGAASLYQVGVLYEFVLVLLVVVALLAVLAAVLGLFNSLGRLRKRYWKGVVGSYMVIVVIASVTMVTSVPAIQQGLWENSSAGSCALFDGPPSPCASFWGSFNGASGAVSWGAGPGWYLTVAGCVSALAAGVSWISISREARLHA